MVASRTRSAPSPPVEAALGAGSWTARGSLGFGGLREGAPADAVVFTADPRKTHRYSTARHGSFRGDGWSADPLVPVVVAGRADPGPAGRRAPLPAGVGPDQEQDA